VVGTVVSDEATFLAQTVLDWQRRLSCNDCCVMPPTLDLGPAPSRKRQYVIAKEMMDFRASSPNRLSGLAKPRGAEGLEDAAPSQLWQVFPRRS
jgi:hypothetical protein